MARTKTEFNIGPHEAAVTRRLRHWKSERFTRRLWEKDHSLWGRDSSVEIEDRLGWLDLPSKTARETDNWKRLAEEIAAEGVTDIVLLGMGGSSLAPEVLTSILDASDSGAASGPPGAATAGGVTGPARRRFHLCDTTHPAAISRLEAEIAPDKTVFVVSSKSGTTIETVSLAHYFLAGSARPTSAPGPHFVAVTDAGTPLEAMAENLSFRAIVRGVPDVGGRFSALSAFGLVPVYLAGIDGARLLPAAAEMERLCAPGIPEDENPGLLLGAALGELALAGFDKLTFLASQSLKALPVWIEQLIAESTGKEGKGILPVVGERASAPDRYSRDRVFVHHALAEEENVTHNAILRSLQARGFPVIRVVLGTTEELGAEMYRWEMATAAACAVLSVHPFDQPDVEGAKKLAREAMAQTIRREPLNLPESMLNPDDPASARVDLDRLLAKRASGDYIALQAYLEPSAEIAESLQALRVRLNQVTRLPVTVGFGPRYLHSTGQFHKGGPDRGIFIQLVDTPAVDLPIPETGHTFSELLRAQSTGDLQALTRLGRRALRLDLGADSLGGLHVLRGLLD